MTDYYIREALPSDAEKLIEYLKIIGTESDNLTFGKEGLGISVSSEQAYLHNLKEDKHSVMYVAIKNGEIIGQVGLDGLPRRMSHRSELGITVRKEEWGKGIGTTLLSKAISYAKDNGIELINLEVRSDNISAIHLYKKFGFKRIGKFPAFFKIDNEYFEFHLMVLDLR
ncbi:MAG: GNAT family N-acetyltransferase [Erysipelotrichaceae bacterium]|nr:GNAT family N-acetyltransferase [Erysipelotrichaceae bacterium]MDY5251398.1 GNAT family N-acetyltransferase [Erysipelotrichaceae bacterium]